MDFGQSAEEKALAEALASNLAKVCSPAKLRAWEAGRVSFDDDFRAAMVSGGFLEAGLPFGDCPLFSALVALEEVAGRFLAPQLLSWQAAFAAFLLDDAAVPAGQFLAVVPPGRASIVLTGTRATGSADGVLFLDQAAHLLALSGDVAVLLPVSTEAGSAVASPTARGTDAATAAHHGATADAVGPASSGEDAPPPAGQPAKVQVESIEIQSLVPQWRLAFQDVPVEVAQAPKLSLALTRLRAALAAWATGAGAQAIELASAYARERRQFEHPIGSYQSVQNRLVDAAVQVEQARMLVYRAAALIDGDDPEAEGMAKLARHQAGKAFVQASRAALLTHGGYGFTADFDVQLYFRRAKEAQLAFEPTVDWPLAPAFRG